MVTLRTARKMFFMQSYINLQFGSIKELGNYQINPHKERFRPICTCRSRNVEFDKLQV